MFTCIFVTLGFLQSQFTEKGFKKAENSEQNVVLLLFLFTHLIFFFFFFFFKWTYILFPVVNSAGSELFPRDADEAKLPKSNQDVPKG